MRAQELVSLIILVNVLYAALVEDKEDRGAIYNFTNIERINRRELRQVFISSAVKSNVKLIKTQFP